MLCYTSIWSDPTYIAVVIATSSDSSDSYLKSQTPLEGAPTFILAHYRNFVQCIAILPMAMKEFYDEPSNKAVLEVGEH